MKDFYDELQKLVSLDELQQHANNKTLKTVIDAYITLNAQSLLVTIRNKGNE